MCHNSTHGKNVGFRQSAFYLERLAGVSLIEGFGGWLQHFVDTNGRADLPCYNPHNLQARALVCNGSQPMDSHHFSPNVTLSRALASMCAVSVLGVVELYHESLCLLRTAITRELPAVCACDGGTEETHHRSSQHTFVTHGLGTSSDLFDALPPTVLQQIDRLTVVDRALYAAGFSRVLYDIARIESTHGRQFLCTGRTRTLLDDPRLQYLQMAEARAVLEARLPKAPR